MHRRRQNNQYSLILSALVFLTSFFAMPRSSSAYEKSPVVHETIDDSAKGNPPIHYLYQVPKLSKGPRALFLLFHGCAHDAFDWFEGKEESCAECRGLPVEVQIAHFAYEQNMAVLAISSLQGCWQQNPDSWRVYKVLKAFSEKDGSDIGDLADKEHVDVYAFGASSGGSFVSHILPQIFDDHFGHLKMRLKGVISQIAPPPELGKITLPMVFSHMPKDVRIARAVRSAVVEMEKSSDVPVKESELHPMKVHETFFRDNAPPGYYETHESEKMFEALKLNGYLDDDGYLKKDPRRSDWRNFICGSLEGENRLAPDAPCENNKSWTSELMNVAWASHEMRFDTFAEDLKFLMEASHFGNQAIEFEDELDENNDMEFHEKREDEGPAPAPSATEEFNLMSQSGDGERMPTRANRPTKRGQPEFPPHWGPVPRMQTRDYRQYPPPYEEYFGSGTVVKWILKQQDMDRENPERAAKEDEGEEAEATKLSRNDEEDGEGTQSEEIEFPKRWGDPPDIQTMDYVELPPPYGHGSSTLRSWIEENLRRDAEFRIPKRREKPAAVEEEEEEENGNEL